MSAGPWGGATKVYTASRAKYDGVVNEVPELFPRIVDAFHMAAAVGIARGQRKEFERQTPEIANMYSVDPAQVLSAVITELHPEASATDRYQLLLEYAEFGIGVIHEEVEATASFDPLPYLDIDG